MRMFSLEHDCGWAVRMREREGRVRMRKRIAARADAEQEVKLLENFADILDAHRVRMDFRGRTAERCLQREQLS